MLESLTPGRRRMLRALAWSLSSLLVMWALAWLAVPPIVKAQAEQRLTQLLGREVRIGRVAFAPWSLTLSVEQVSLASATGSARSEPQMSIGSIKINADLRSLLRLAPVVEALEIQAPVIRLARLADGRYDIDDIVARFATRPAPDPSQEPARFALYNLRIADGAIEFDDRPVARLHRVQALEVALPFLSNLPDDIAISTEPRVAFKLNGASFDSGAQTKPFAQDRASQIALTVGDLDLAPWLPYLPATLPLKPTQGRLATELQLQFALAPDGTPRLSLRGKASLADVALSAATAPAAALPALAWRRLDLVLADVQPLVRKVALGSVTLAGAQVDARRSADGHLNLIPAAPQALRAAEPAASAPPSAAAAWQLSVDKVALTQARIDWHDDATRSAAALRLEPLDLDAGPLRWPFQAPVPLKLSARLAALDAKGAPLGEAASLSLQGQGTDRIAEAEVQLQGLDLAWLQAYAAQALTARLEGRASASTLVKWSAGESGELALSQVNAQVDQLRLMDSARGRPPVAIESIALADSQLDLAARQLRIGSLKLTRPVLALARNPQGQWNFEAWQRNAAPTPAAAASEAMPWKLQLGELALAAGELRLADEHPSSGAGGTPVKLLASAISANVQGLHWPSGPAARSQLQLRLAEGDAPAASRSAGRIDWSGQLAPAPLSLRGQLRIERLPLHAFEPYVGSGLNLALLRAEANWRGDIALAQRSGGWDASAKGDAQLSDLRVHERAGVGARGGDELLSWQAFRLTGLRFEMRADAKPTLAIAEAALSDFYSRLVITEDGRFNLRDVAAAPAPEAAASAPASAASGLPIEIAIGGVRLSNGRVDFTDRFVRPNYSAALSELNGSLGAFSSGSREMAAIELKGRAAGSALLEIGGSLNPSVRPLALDIRAKATELELAPLSPYAGRYAGYAIERGKLSMDVAYKIDADGKLEARNQVVLNQLTFGDKVESPDATKLPVLLAVALLKDRNGVIDIDLPISGSINDPQFSVFGIVLKIIGNLLVKALTAPFALLAGGGSEDLSVVAFEPGSAAMSPAGRAALDKVAKALTERPVLKMTVTGASDPQSEREAIQRAALNARIAAEQRRDALRAGSAAEAALPALTVAQREALLRRIYDDARLPDKPRNLIGLAKTIPAAEMEALLMKATIVSTDSARELALQRGLAVRDALVAKGLPSERLFLAAPKLRASGEDDGAWSPRVQLSLSTN
jgi:uncharacterized protein involved in outer membrane biogenesis